MARKKKEAKPAAQFIGNRHTNQFHLIGFEGGSCNLDEITAEHKVEFGSFEEAVSAGFEGCGHCTAHLDRGQKHIADPDPEC